MKVYIAGKITGHDDYKKAFYDAETLLKKAGHIPLNPARLNEGFEHDEYMKICYAMITVCDAVFFLDNWTESKGARLERCYAETLGKVLMSKEDLEGV